MTIYYSPTTRGFHHSGIHDSLPEDKHEIGPDQFAALMAAQAEGKTITPDENGFPVAVDVPKAKPAIEQISTLEAEITPRRIREAILGTDGGWLKVQDDAIAKLRSRVKS